MKSRFLSFLGLLAGVGLLVQPEALRAQPASTTNYVLSLGGTNGFLELPSGAFNDLEEVTIEGWVKWMDDRPNRLFFDFGREERDISVARFWTTPDIGLFIITRRRCE